MKKGAKTIQEDPRQVCLFAGEHVGAIATVDDMARTVGALCAGRGEFTADDVWERLEREGLNKPDRMTCKRLGAVVKGAAADGRCRFVTYMKSRSPKRNGGPCSLWKGIK